MWPYYFWLGEISESVLDLEKTLYEILQEEFDKEILAGNATTYSEWVKGT